MELLLLTLGIFGVAMIGMSIGVILSNSELNSSCGGQHKIEGIDASCGSCSKKEIDLCPTDSDLVRIAQLGHPDPAHHRH